MGYFNYHAKAKNLIKNKKLIRFEILSNYHGISPALVLYFKDNIIMPIREQHFEDYFKLIDENFNNLN